jgi:Zn finger protein HypA/HybF involved in hydrogenase expression
VTYDNRKTKLIDNLRPKTKESVGKVEPCKRCGSPAEYYSANYQHCPRCDAPKARATPSGPAYEFELTFDDDETTNPGFGFNVSAWYRCHRCQLQTLADTGEVANGLGCPLCSGPLYRMPTP